MAETVTGTIKTANECWQQYPRHKFPDSLSQGASRRRARDACIAASIQGKPDPELYDGPAILKNYRALWQSKYPWNERPKDTSGQTVRTLSRIFLSPTGTLTPKSGGDVLRSTAIGWRPYMGTGQDRFVETEQKATILGGAEVLALAGVYPWSSMVIPALDLKLRGDKNDYALVNLVKEGTGTKYPSVKEAAEAIRQIVIDHGLEAAAWSARAARMGVAAGVAQKKRQIALTTASTAVTAAGMALNGTVIGAIVGLPLTVIGLTLAAASGQTQIEKVRSDGMTKKMSEEVGYQLQLVGLNQKTQELEREMALAQSSMAAATPLAVLEGQQLARNIQIGVWLSVVSITTLGVYWVAFKPKTKD